MGCLFINAHNKPISEVFNFNTNIQIGDALQVFYSTLYTSKSTQDVDSEKQLRMGHAVIKRIKLLLDQNQTNGCDQTTSEPSFGEGLSRVSGLNAATTRNVISSTMARLISCNNGSQFVFSHKICRRPFAQPRRQHDKEGACCFQVNKSYCLKVVKRGMLRTPNWIFMQS